MWRTIHPSKVRLLSKWSDSSVMLCLSTADEKGERFCLVAGLIQYLMEAFTKAWLLLARIKWFIFDVIPHFHLITRKRNRIIKPQELILPSKLSEFSVMWYVYIADEKVETFNPVAGTIPYLTEALTKARLLLAKMNWLICDVIADCHLIGERRNNKQDYWSTVTALAVQM